MGRSTAGRDTNGLRQILTLVAIFATLGVNTYTNLSPPTGVNIGQLSNTLFANVRVIPANYAFAIWGLIYIGLIAFGIYQLNPNRRQNSTVRKVGDWLTIACIAQIFWVFLFLYQQFWLSVIAMLAILLPLILIFQTLKTEQPRPSREERWFVHIPMSVYLGWITVATVVNIASALYSSGWNGWGISSEVWTIVLMVISAAIAAAIVLQRRDAAFALVIVWALVAIAVRQWSIAAIGITALVLAAGVAILTAVKARRSQSLAG